MAGLSMRRIVIIVPFLLALASLLHLNYIASMVVSPDQILRPLAVLWLLLALLIWPAWLLTRDWNWAALLLSVFVAGFYFSGDFFSTFLLFVLLVGAIWLAYARLRRRKVKVLHLLSILAAAGIFFTAYALVLIGSQLIRIDWTAYRQQVRDARNYALETRSKSARPPDIYYIILDGYARSDILHEMYGFDNQEFLAYLHEKGFTVPASSRSNYPATPLSIASSLNMDYIQALVPGLVEIPHRWLMAPLIDYSRVRAVLEAQGYQTISLSSNWTVTENETTDMYLHPYPVMLTDFEGFILSVTPLRALVPLLERFISAPTAGVHREVVRYEFQQLAELPRLAGPKFVFVHIISPHPPFVFDSVGNPLEIGYPFTFRAANEYPGSYQDYPRKYSDQVQFVNQELEKAIDAILEQSDTPPIILLQSDHGSGMLTNLDSSEGTCIRERFSPFAAYYLPNLETSAIPPDVSAVNLFRIVLNEYFDAALPLLGDSQYFYRDKQNYYEFEDVTGRVEEACKLPE